MQKFRFNTEMPFVLVSWIIMTLILSTLGIVNVSASSPHARRASKPKTAKVTIQAYYTKCKTSKKQDKRPGVDSYFNANTERWTNCTGNPGSKAVLWVESHDLNANCNGITIHNGTVDMGRVRKLSCTPGFYNFRLRNHANVHYGCRGDLCNAEDNTSFDIKAGQNYRFKLGTTDRQ